MRLLTEMARALNFEAADIGEIVDIETDFPLNWYFREELNLKL